MRILTVATMLLGAAACVPAGANLYGNPDDGVELDQDGTTDDDATDEPVDVAHALILADLQVYELSGEYPIEPGDTVRVDVRLVNPTGEGWYEYPGVQIATTPSIVDGDAFPYMFYGILPRSTIPASFDLVIPAGFTGDTLTVTTEVVALAPEFSGGDRLSIEVPVGD